MERLKAAIEQWYVWLERHGNRLFSPADVERMQQTVRQVSETYEKQCANSLIKTDWFLTEGAPLYLERLRKGDYDLYE